MVVSQDQSIRLLDLAALEFQKQALNEFPDGEITFNGRSGGMGPAMPRDTAKTAVPLSTLAIMDMEIHEGELFVAGVATDNFLSSLRRMSYPFDGTQSIANVEMYHIAHDQYESRAPITRQASSRACRDFQPKSCRSSPRPRIVQAFSLIATFLVCT